MNNLVVKILIIMLVASASFLLGRAQAQGLNQGLTLPANTNGAYQGASVARDSGLSQPLDLLNDFYPAIEVTIADHDNVRRRPGFQESDLKIVAKPSLGYRTNIGRHKFYASYTGVFSFHDELEQEDAQSHTGFAKLGLDLTRRWDLDVFAGVGESFEERGISGAREFDRFEFGGVNSGPEEVDHFAYGADLIFGRKIGIITGVLGFEHVETNFTSNDLPFGEQAGDRDRESDALHLDVNWNFAARTSVFGRVQRTEVDYNANRNTLDSDQTDYLVGLRWKPSARLNGVVGVGRSDKDFDDPSRRGYDGNTYYTNLSYRISPYSVVDFGASRIVEEPGDERSSYYESEYFGLGWNHAFTSKLSFDVYAKWLDDDYDIGREDKFFDWGLGLDYVWRRWLTAGVYYGETERDSTRESVEYEDAFFGIRLRSDLRSLFSGRRDQVIEPASFEYPRKTQRSQ